MVNLMSAPKDLDIPKTNMMLGQWVNIEKYKENKVRNQKSQFSKARNVSTDLQIQTRNPSQTNTMA